MPGFPGALRPERILLDQIEDGNSPFLFNIGVAPKDRRLVEFDMDDARVGHDWLLPLQMQHCGARD